MPSQGRHPSARPSVEQVLNKRLPRHRHLRLGSERALRVPEAPSALELRQLAAVPPPPVLDLETRLAEVARGCALLNIILSSLLVGSTWSRWCPFMQGFAATGLHYVQCVPLWCIGHLELANAPCRSTLQRVQFHMTQIVCHRQTKYANEMPPDPCDCCRDRIPKLGRNKEALGLLTHLGLCLNNVMCSL